MLLSSLFKEKGKKIIYCFAPQKKARQGAPGRKKCQPKRTIYYQNYYRNRLTVNFIFSTESWITVYMILPVISNFPHTKTTSLTLGGT
tara:strand:+ start:7201 stop:7464 length:264 start_codon:yes stop_codon:yes gene_type:complete